MIPREAITLENFQRSEKGLPPIKVKKEPRPEPEKPTVEDEITFEDLPDTEIFEFSGRRRVEKNEAGTRFTGYTIFLETRSGEILEGWLDEGNFEKLRQRLRVEAPHLLQKIGL